ncbi:MAG: hypothetical protein H6667_07780 [Ardenticatenaceae bacterium]|nr:hypothetical protein [Ardenticatenaceae bacterium]MCB9443846.1 hypothetical protein [Ardenticatenaceae bacterium]
MTDNDSNTPEERPSSVTLLSDLLASLYPEPGPDILTLDDFKRRYRLTGLGPLAVGAIQQAQRINRDSGRFNEIGLCEFHIGLIYLDWNDYQGAVQQFREARLQWSFIDKTAAICLTHLAEGLAQHHRFAYEAALSQYGKAENCQKRIKFEPSSDNRDGFLAQLNQTLQTAQKAARELLWEPTPSLTVGESAKVEEEVEMAGALSAEKEVTPETVNVLPPEFPHQKQTGLSFPFPIPQNGLLTWYQATVKRHDPIFPEITQSGWLLVHRPENDPKIKENSLVVVASDDPDMEASIVLKKLGNGDEPGFPRIFLARNNFEASFSKEDSRVQLSDIHSLPIDIEHFLGYVIGWFVA